ncbi:MAG: DUF5689 domain-containing protein [Bacteroidales bacterium]|nr:DUF5689 domain-containing protein [Bacteroidales bacterium]
MRKIYNIFLAAVAAAVCLSSCEEWEPVFTTEYDTPEITETELKANTTITEIKAMYKNAPVKIDDDIIIKGQVTTSDAEGNFYRSFYIQDETGAIEIKIGQSYTCNTYKLGQWVYIKCSGLTIGKYGGMIQLGFQDYTGSYETAYMDVKYIIDSHIFKGKLDTPVAPVVIDEAGLTKPENYGKYVTVKGLTYGNEVFAILYDANRTGLYLSDTACGIDTWAMSENGFKAYMTATTGKEEPQSAFAGNVTKDNWKAYYSASSAYDVSQYFKIGKTDLQVRTSGYSKFADTKIPAEILAGAVTELTGILTIYNQNIQFVLIDDSSKSIKY